MRKICSDTGDELVEQHYKRFKPLVVESKTLLGDLRNVKSGDCVVAFSRREIFGVKLAIEKQTKYRCCVIHGALPPETRRMQATLFNDQDNEFDVLVASDAVGMGLNLNIRTGINKVANMLENVPGLSLEDHYNFCFAPVNLRDPKAMYHLLRFASSFSQKLPVNIAMSIPTGSARNDSELFDLETNHQVCSMYMWLSNHFKKENFPYRQKAKDMASNIANYSENL
ncbi:DExH-box ATP-dependent RNA helicase DExH18 mitochondrial [Bienertia sinuspersici]